MPPKPTAAHPTTATHASNTAQSVVDQQQQPQVLLFLLDVTASMTPWVHALIKILPEVIDTTTLTGAFDAAGIITYGDYDLPETTYPVGFSGWGALSGKTASTMFKQVSPRPPVEKPTGGSRQSRKPKGAIPSWANNPSHSMEEVIDFAKELHVRGGGGCPEAVKTAMYGAVNVCRETLYGFDEADGPEAIGQCPFVHMIHLTDATLHVDGALDGEGKDEKRFLGPANFEVATVFNRLIVGLRHQLRYSCLCSNTSVHIYSHLAAITGGASIVPPNVSVESLRTELQGLIAGWMGALPKDKQSVEAGPNRTVMASAFEDKLREVAADATKQMDRLKYLPVVLGAADTEHPFVPMVDTSNSNHVFPVSLFTTDKVFTTKGLKTLRDPTKGPLPTVAVLAAKLKQSARRMKSDGEFVDDIASTLRRICSESPMALCGNDVMGAMWRAFCTRREDPRRDEYLQLLDKSKNALNGSERAVFEAWNMRSYNVSSEIRKYVQDFAAKNGVSGVVRFEGDAEGFVPQSVNEAFLSLKREGLQSVSEVLSRLQVDRGFQMSAAEAAAAGKTPGTAEEEGSDGEDDEDQPTALADNVLPLNMPAEDLFRHLLHIAIPGSRLSRRPAALLAVCAVRTGCVVKEEAATYLSEIKGKWIDWRRRKDLNLKVVSEEDGNAPVVQENFNGAFMRLVRSVDGVLTDAERETTHYMQRITAVLSYDRREVEMAVIDPKSTDGCFPDHVSQCGCCLLMRPLSLLMSNTQVGDECGYCLRARTEAGKALNKRDLITKEHPPVMSPSASRPESQMQVRCVKCTGYYARAKGLRRVDISNCHYCQFGLAPSTVECASCKNLIVSPGRRALPGGVCGPCASGAAPRKVTTDTKPLPMRILFPRALTESAIVAAAGLVRCGESSNNSLIPAGTSLPDAVLMFDQAASLSEATLGALSEIPPNPFTTTPPQLERDAVVQATHMRHMLNEDALWKRVVKSVRLTGRVGVMPTCMMCCDEFQPDKMSRTCGRKGCEQRMCMTCLGEWYGKSVLGKAVVPRSLLCPCCGRTPAPSVLRKGNRDALQMHLHEQCQNYGVGGDRVEGTYNTGMQPGEALTKVHFGWCMRCSKVGNYANKECNDFDPSLITEYVCTPCRFIEMEEAESSSSDDGDDDDEYMTAERWKALVAQAREEKRTRRVNLNVRVQELWNENRAARGMPALLFAPKVKVQCKKCPKCETRTLRAGGCACITCPVCAAHWCYVCALSFQCGDDVYRHMANDVNHMRLEMLEVPLRINTHDQAYDDFDIDTDEDEW